MLCGRMPAIKLDADAGLSECAVCWLGKNSDISQKVMTGK